MNSENKIIETRAQLKPLSNAEVIQRTEHCAREERRISVALIAHLEEIDARMLFLEFDCQSTWEFCVKHLKLSEGAASRRVSAMRLTRDLPEAKIAIREGTLSLSSASTLQSFFREEKKLGFKRDAEQKLELMTQVQGLSKRETEQVLVAIQPGAIPQERERIVAPDRIELKLVVTDAFREKLGRLRELFAHSHPHASQAELLELAMTLAIESKEKKLGMQKRSTTPPAAQTKRLRSTSAVTTPTNPNSPRREHIPINDRRALFQRAESRCEFINQSGLRCTSRYALQIDHRTPVALGGLNQPQNLRILCAKHNQAEAVRVFGEAKMSKYLRT